MAPQPGFGNQPESKAVRITVVGHASARWRGAKNKAEADRLNDALSTQRANNVRAQVEKILKQAVPNLTIDPGASPAPAQHPNGVQVGSYGVGSHQPLLNPPPPRIDPQENNPVNRSVLVVLELTTTKYGQVGVSRPPRRISAMTRFWYGKVMMLSGAILVGGTLYLRLEIRNSLSDKVATYDGWLLAAGLGAEDDGPDKPAKLSNPGQVPNPRQVLHGIGDEFSFYTDTEMGFTDFDGQLVRIEQVGAALGIRANAAYITFVNLGHGASLLKYEGGFGVGLKRALKGYVASGWIKISGSNPGDWFEVDGGTDTVPFTTDSKQGDGVILSFPTGKASFNDLPADEQRSLQNFVTRWAQRI